MSSEPPLRFEALPDLDRDDEEVRYLVGGVLPASQVGLLAAPVKTLKTSLAADLAFSVATGTPFLNAFPVSEPGRVVFISGEAGRATLKDTFRRIAKSRGMTLRDGRNLDFTSDLPDMSDTATLRLIADRSEGAALCVLDPWYLMAKVGDGAGNMFRMGERLAPLKQISDGTGASILVLHHSRYGDAKKKPTLNDAAFAGVKEWARYWILPKHRQPWRAGLSKLWLMTGGSSGHAGDWHVDVDEGVRSDDGSQGRYWHPGVTKAGDSGAAAASERGGEPADMAPDDETVLAYLRSQPDGATVNAISSKAFYPKRKRKPGVNAILNRLHSAGLVTHRKAESRGKPTVRWSAA